MGYRITYSKEEQKKHMSPNGRRCRLTALLLGIFLLLTVLFWPEGREVLKILLIPEDADFMFQAAEVFAQELGSGSSLSNAARNFCISVLEHGYPG